MSFEKPITIKEAVENINKKKFLLPAIQREFVWSTEQIELLFDSLMRGFPIGSFLFWQVEKEECKAYQYYEFIRNYHERDNTHNPKADTKGDEGLLAIIDGQQRLTAFYLGLKGSYAYKLPRRRWNNDWAFPTRNLYLNLLKPSEDEDKEYDFKFLTREEYELYDMDEISDDDTFWFKVGDILEINEPHKVNDYLINKDLSTKAKDKALFANKTLFRLFKIIHDDPIVNYFLEKENNLDKVLKIFIRMNSGGTELSYSDILLSIATALWRKKDAREEINALVDIINKTGGGFNFDKDFILKTCLVLSDFTDIAFKVNNFNASNMAIIEQNWDTILKAIRLSVTLVASYGYNRDTLTSNYVLIPIAYYLLNIGLPDNFHLSSNYKIERVHIVKWVIMSLLKRAFGGTPDNVLRPIRQILSLKNEGFPIDDIIERFKATTKSIIFTDDDIDNLFTYKYKQNYTFSTLALLYPTLDFRNKFHQDHIFPRKFFTRKRLLKHGISESKIDTYIENMNSLANLQLLEGTPNQEKAGEDFNTWLSDRYQDRISRRDYMEKHCIPNIDLSLDNFDSFVIERQKIMKAKYNLILKLISSEESFKKNSDFGIINHINKAINIDNLQNEMTKGSKEIIQQQNYIKGKMYKLNELMLLELKKTKPDKIQIGNIKYDIKSWTDLCIFTVKWLIEKGYLTNNNIPISNSAQNGKYFINSAPVHLIQEKDACWKKVGDYFIDTKHDANHHIKNIIHTLKYLEISDADIMISLG